MRVTVFAAENGLRELIAISNADIDRICAQAAEFASDDHVDVEVRQQLATMLFDNAEMRKQLNAYTEGILMQTMERLDQLGVNDGGGGGAPKPAEEPVSVQVSGMSGLLQGKKESKPLLKQNI